MLTVNEIFYSIQGESTHAGQPCVFVRLTACDLRCSWCDTAYAFHEGRKQTVDEVIAAVVKIVDVKCPGSGEADKNEWRNLDRLLPHDQVKFVVKDRTDYEFARDVARRHDLAPRCAAVLISPVHGELDARTLSEWMLADSLPA